MTIVPRKLYTTLDPPPGGLFAVAFADETPLGDGDVEALTITRGGSTIFPGVTPSTCTITVRGGASRMRGSQNVSVRLTDAAASAIATATNAPRDIASRFTGRVGQQTVDDTGRRHGSLMHTSYMAASRSALLSQSRDTITIAKGDNLGSAIQALMTPFDQTQPTPVLKSGIGYYGNVWTAPAPGKPGDMLNAFTADVGLIVRDTRAGVPEVLTLRYVAGMLPAADLPLLRRHTIRPATWRQDRELDASLYWLDYTDADGNTATAGYGGDASPGQAVVRLDRKWVQWADPEQPNKYVSALRATQWGTVYEFDALEVDLLALWRSGAYARDTIGRLLGLELYDLVPLAADWPEPVRGYYVVTGITETITGRSWRIKLQLAPYEFVIGSPSPTPTARTWDASASATWDAAAGTWNDA